MYFWLFTLINIIYFCIFLRIFIKKKETDLQEFKKFFMLILLLNFAAVTKIHATLSLKTFYLFVELMLLYSVFLGRFFNDHLMLNDKMKFVYKWVLPVIFSLMVLGKLVFDLFK